MKSIDPSLLSNRISRLVQPRKYSATPHTLNRNRSSSIENVASYNRQTNKRSRSATPNIASETPVRPIARSLSVLFTPASTSKNVIPKKPVTEQVTRILEVLRSHFGPTFLSNGLQSMSAKQFVEIIRFFAESIFGDKVTIQDNNVDDVKRFVDLMEYPHQMNKSWFKAPTVSIAYDRNVEFLDWLCDFVSIGDGDMVENNVAESDDFMDQQFIASFIADCKYGFVIWSDRKDEFDELKGKWIHKLIVAKTQIDDIDAAVDRLQNDYKNLETKDSIFGNEHLLLTQQKKSDELGAEVMKMKAIVAGKNFDFQETSDELNKLTLEHQELIDRINGLKMTIQNQEVSDDDRKDIVTELEEKQHRANEKRAFVQSLKSNADDNQIKIARLRNQKTSKVFAINGLIEKLLQIGINFGDTTINQLTMRENDTKDQIKTKLQLIGQLKETINKRRAEVQASVNVAHTKQASISTELFHIEDEAGVHKKHVHSLEIQLQKIDNQIVDTKYDLEQEHHQLQVNIDNMRDVYEQIGEKIKNSGKLAESLREQNKEIFQGIESKANALLEAKMERQARREAAILELERLTDQLNDAVKKFK